MLLFPIGALGSLQSGGKGPKRAARSLRANQFGSITFCVGKNREGPIRIVVFRVCNRRVFPSRCGKIGLSAKGGESQTIVLPNP